MSGSCRGDHSFSFRKHTGLVLEPVPRSTHSLQLVHRLAIIRLGQDYPHEPDQRSVMTCLIGRPVPVGSQESLASRVTAGEHSVLVDRVLLMGRLDKKHAFTGEDVTQVVEEMRQEFALPDGSAESAGQLNAL